MDARRQQRVQLVRALFGADATMETCSSPLPGPPRARWPPAWAGWNSWCATASQATTRNGSLMADQHA
jgi:flagella synthesis protein FlgN